MPALNCFRVLDRVRVDGHLGVVTYIDPYIGQLLVRTDWAIRVCGCLKRVGYYLPSRVQLVIPTGSFPHRWGYEQGVKITFHQWLEVNRSSSLE